MPRLVLLVDDHPVFRVGLAATLNPLDANLRVVEAASVLAAVDILATGAAIDLVLYDWHMPGGGGVPGLVAIRQLAPEVPVVVITADEDEAIRIAALHLGAAELLSKAADPASLRASLGRILQRPPSPSMQRTPPGAEPLPVNGRIRLSHRQHEVLLHLAQGEPNKRIAEHLGIAETTVRQHVSDILRLLLADNRTEAVVKARRLGLLDFG